MKLRSAYFARIAVGVFPIREQHHTHIHASFQNHIDASQGSLDSGSITIKEYGYVFSKSANGSDLTFRKRCA